MALNIENKSRKLIWPESIASPRTLDEWAEKWKGTDQEAQCIGIWGDPNPKPPGLTPAEFRHKKRGQRLAKLVTSFAEWLAPALMSMLRESILELIRQTLVEELPDLHRILHRKRRRAG